MNDSQTSTDSELDWLAFQYVAGELPARECEAFEFRLAEDQTAREAVVRAVNLVGALAATRPAAPKPMPIPRTSTLSLRWRRLAGAACVAALVVLGISLRLLQGPAATDKLALTADSNARTVSGWVTLGPSDDEHEADELELSFNDGEQAPKADIPADDLAVPSWMVAALEHDHDDRVEED